MAVKLDTIYKRTSTGKVQEWTIEIDNDKYRTISGQVDGKKVTSEWTVCKGKNIGKANETTGAEQALKEATAKRDLKLEAEYRTRADAVDELEFKKPLLAKEYKEYKNDITFPFWSQPKLDGVRCITSITGMLSRNGKPFLSAPHIYDALSHFFDIYPNLEFDGELYNHTLRDNFDKIISLVRKQKPTGDEILESAETVEYWIYDVREPKMNFEERSKFLHKCIQSLPAGSPIRFVQTVKVANQEELDALYADYLEDGFEGQMIRTNGKGYEFTRSKNLLKRKEFIDEDFLILDIVEGIGNRSGMAGYMVFEREGKRFKANIRGGNDYYVELLQNKDDYINKKYATVRYQNLTPEGIPRFPVVVAVRDYE